MLAPLLASQDPMLSAASLTQIWLCPVGILSVARLWVPEGTLGESHRFAASPGICTQDGQPPHLSVKCSSQGVGRPLLEA